VVAFAGVAILIGVLGGCSAATPQTGGGSGGTDSGGAGVATAGLSRVDIARTVDIGGGRELYLECRGSGSPTVVLISGTGGAADEWTTEVDTADAAAPPTPSTRSVFDTLARTGRVCAYDRPGTTVMSGGAVPSTPVVQPTSARQGVDDLHALLSAVHETGPIVVVGASWGGMIAQLYAREHPHDVRGIVLVDSASVFLTQTFTPTQWTNWINVIADAHTKSPDAESPNYDASVAEFTASAAMPDIPATVLSSDHPWDLAVTPGQSTWPAWLAAQASLAQSLHATHVSKTDSGHGIAVEQPALVASAIREVVTRSR
jgi:pimeloyl-ACP methyl ester carboxylesterase